jgi:hypothetical protein
VGVYKIDDILRWPRLAAQAEVKQATADAPLMEHLLREWLTSDDALKRAAHGPQAEKVACAVAKVAERVDEERLAQHMLYIVGDYLIVQDAWRVRRAIEHLLAAWRSRMGPATTRPTAD